MLRSQGTEGEATLSVGLVLTCQILHPTKGTHLPRISDPLLLYPHLL